MLMNNYPTQTYISWFGLVIVPNREGATPYIVEDGKSCMKYIYWDETNPYRLKESNEWVEESATIKRIYINENGGGTEVPQQDITLYYNDIGNGSSNVVTGKLLGKFDEIDDKFITITEDVNGIKEAIGSSTVEEGSLINRLNKVEKTAESTKETLESVKTEYETDSTITKLRNDIGTELINVATSLSRYRTTINDISKDLEVSLDEKQQISDCQVELLEYLNSLYTHHNSIIDILNNKTEDNSATISSLNRAKENLSTAIANLNSNVNTSISDNTIVPSEISLMLNMLAVSSVRLNEYKNTIDDSIILGVGGSVTESILEIEKTSSEFSQTMSNIIEDIDGETGIKSQISKNSTSIKQTAEDIQLNYAKYDKTTSSLTVADNQIKLDAGKVLMTGTLTWDSLDDDAKNNLKGEDGANGTAEYIMLVGDQIIKYDTSGNPITPNVLLTIMTSGVSSTAPTTWMYKNPNSNTWTEIRSNANNYSYTLNHNNTIWNGYDSITIRAYVDNNYWDDITVVKLKDGINGEGARYVRLVGEQIFKYTIPRGQANFVPHENSLTLIGEKHNIDANGTKWYYRRPSSSDWILMSEYNGMNTLTINHNDNRYFNTTEKNNLVKIKFELGTYDDTMTIMKIYDGKDSVMATLTNETHTLPCKSNGEPFTYDGATTTLNVYVGTVNDSNNWTYTNRLTNLVGTFSDNGRTFTVTDIKGDVGYVDITASKNLFDSLTRRFTVTKSINGINGTNGKDSTAYWLTSTANTIKKEKIIGEVARYKYTPNEIIFEGKSQSGDRDVENFNGKFVVSELIRTYENDNVVENWVTKYASKNLESNIVYNIADTKDIVSFKVGFYNDLDKDILLDQQNITTVSDGKEGKTTPTAILDNESHVIPCNFAGMPQNFNGAVSTISVFLGSIDDSDNWTYSIKLIDIDGLASNNNRTFTVTNIKKEVGYVDFTASKEGFDSITKRFTLSKVNYGEDGEGAKYITVIGEQTFKYSNNFEGTPTPSTIILTANKYNISTVGKWQYRGSNGNYIDLNVTSNTLTVTPTTANLNTKNICTFRYTAEGYSDEITIIKISDGGNGNDGSDGEDGLYVLLTNESHIVPCDENGNYTSSELSKAKTEIHVYKGIEEIDYTATFASTGCESAFNKSTKTLYLTKLSSNSATINIRITVEGKTFDRVMTITKSLRGATGKDGAGLNVIGELDSVSNLPSSGLPGDAYIIKGLLYVWVKENNRWSDGVPFKGEQGLPGKDGIDGRTTYLHIKYSDDGIRFTSNNGETVGKWLGQYVDFYENDSSVFSDYTWKKIVGDDGDNAIVSNLSNDSHVVPTLSDGSGGIYTGCNSTITLFSGAQPLTSNVTYSVVVSNGVSGTWDSSTGTYTVSNMSTDEGYADLTARYNGIAYTKRFTISKNKQGLSGSDAYTINLSNDNHSFVSNSEGKIEYQQSTTTTITAFKGTEPQRVVINSLPTVNGLTITNQGTTISITANVGTTLAINGTFSITITVDGRQFVKQFTYSKVACGSDGRDGINGTDGINGINGINGKDGITYYTWIKYSDYADGSNLYDSPNENTTYIGISPNQTSQLESVNKDDYKWSKFRGDDGIAGTNGIDGKTYYTWVKYADDSSGSGISNSSEGKKYIGLAYNKSTQTESNTPSDYTWTLIKGSDGTNGTDGYTIYLTNEAHCFTCEDNGKITTDQSTTTIVKVFKGTVEKTPTIGSITAPNGLNISKNGATITITASKIATLADSGSFNIPFTVDGRSFIKIFSWSKSYKGANGSNGQNASYVVVTGEQTFKYSNNFSGAPTPSSIVLNVSKFNISTNGKWQYMNSNGTYVDLNVTTDTLTVTPTTGMLSSRNTCTFRYIVGSYSDTITIAKISDGAKGDNGEDSYSVLLTNECHSFPCENNGNIASDTSTTTIVLAYKGATPITPTIGNITAPNGMSISRSGSTITIKALKGSSLDPVGSFNIPITVNGISFTKTFSWSKSYKGANGLDGNDLVLPSWITEWNGNTTEVSGSKIVTPKIFAGTVTNGVPTGVAIGKNVLGTTGSYANANGIVGYKNGTKTYTFDTDGSVLIGTSPTTGNRVYWNGSSLDIVANSVKIGSENALTSSGANSLIDTKINNIQIGGRNLISNSAPKSTANWSAITGWSIDLIDEPQAPYGKCICATNNSATSISGVHKPPINTPRDLVDGEYYVLSAYIKASKNCKIRFSNEKMSNYNTFTSITTEWKKYEFTGEINISNQYGSDTFYVHTSDIEVGMKLYIHSVQLEKGTKSTAWTQAPEDTETLIDDAINDLSSDLQTQIDGKIQTYYQTTDPSTNWATATIKTQHTGDIWQNSSTNVTYRWSGTSWSELKNQTAINANALASKKAQIFTATPTVPYYKGDLWITNLSGTGAIKTCAVTKTSGSYTASDWVEGLKYIDSSTVEAIVVGKIDAQTQTDIFNKLTNNGANQGIYLENGSIYINGSMIKAGMIKGDMIDAKGLNVAGRFSISQNNGSVLMGANLNDNHVYWDGNMLDIKADSIKIGSEDVASKTEVSQKIGEVKFQFSQSGGANLLRNSSFRNDWNYWDSHSYQCTGTGRRYIRTNVDDWGFPDGGVSCAEMRLSTSNGANCEYGISQIIQTTIGETYTISFYYACHRLTKAYVLVRGTNESDSGWHKSADINLNTGSSLTGGNQTINKWGFFKTTFTAIKSTHTIEIDIVRVDDSVGDGCLWIAKPMVSEGDLATGYTGHRSEVYSGVTRIDSNGVTVNMADGEGTQGYTRIAHDGMEIYNSAGRRIAWFGDSDTAYIGTLSADKIYNRHLIKWSEGRPTNFYLAPNSTGDGTGRNANNKSNSIEHTLNYIWNTWGCYSWAQDIVLNLDAGDYWSSSNYIGGFLGTGTIWIKMSPWACLRSRVRVEECSMQVIITGTVDGTNTDVQNNAYIWVNGEDAVSVRNSSVSLRGLNIRRSGWSGYAPGQWYDYYQSGVWGEYGANITVVGCDVVGFADMFYVYDSSTIATYYCRGHCWRYGPVQLGSLLKCVGSMPVASQATQYWGGVVIADGNQYSVNSWYDPKPDAPYTPPPQPTENWQWVSSTFNANSLSTYPEGSGVTTSGKRDSWGQGSWSSYKSHRGYASFSGISGWCSGGRNFSATLTMTRLNTSHGYAGAVPVPKIKNTDGSFWNCGIAFARGDTKSISLPSSITNALAGGNWDTLEMWAGASNNDYSFYNNVSITIWCEKNMI